MGGGVYSGDIYRSYTSTKASKGIDDFAYSKTATAVNKDLDPIRIKDKINGKLESRDSVEHPESNAFLVCFDVTGSNYQNAEVAQKQFAKLMELLSKYVSDPQVAIAANDDCKASGPRAAFQISEFESDNTLDQYIDLVWLVGRGGGNFGESYDLCLYAAARKTATDCYEVRGKKGYLFMYCDEPFFDQVSASEVKAVFGDDIQHDIPIGDIIDEVKERYNVFILWPGNSSYTNARKQYVELFGEDSVVTLEHPKMICEQIAAMVGLNEDKTTATTAVDDLVAVGVSASAAQSLVKASVATIKGAAKASGTLPVVGKGGASRL